MTPVPYCDLRIMRELLQRHKFNACFPWSHTHKYSVPHCRHTHSRGFDEAPSAHKMHQHMHTTPGHICIWALSVEYKRNCYFQVLCSFLFSLQSPKNHAFIKMNANPIVLVLVYTFTSLFHPSISVCLYICQSIHLFISPTSQTSSQLFFHPYLHLCVYHYSKCQ